MVWNGIPGGLAAAAIAAIKVNRHLELLEYDTFTSQSIHG
jgi:hypothetical protein